MARTYGWIPDLPDARDNVYQLPLKLATPPPSVDLRAGCPAVYDQGDLGSCTANMIGAAIEFDQMKQKISSRTPSRLFIYYNERVIEGSVDSDSGAQIRDGIKTVASAGRGLSGDDVAIRRIELRDLSAGAMALWLR